MGLPTELQDIRLLLNQRSKANFEWTPYKDLAIREVILKEFFMNPNAWHIKVPLVVYAIVEMHKTDRSDENWPVFHSQHINMWNRPVDASLKAQFQTHGCDGLAPPQGPTTMSKGRGEASASLYEYAMMAPFKSKGGR
ncbi:hypothetical protein Goari_022249, partial [Gossypium aridum]|nr:hypothetical protein [Gossypium aridum]